ncbi:hypothetical protein GCM10007392_45950 [Saccharospirillum salsuginis]|uniref:Cysteine-rich secretory protein family protein n=1 Tax=Saccharospirillum salsuginis TaxID=418750 RepID=A0A918NHE8_9GAMM|nr:hypothetical protein GCM10007392_45950 [Saccharospirillum salsuginis]
MVIKDRIQTLGWVLTLALALTGCNLESVSDTPEAELTYPEMPLRAREHSSFGIVDHSPVDGERNQSLVRDVMVSFDAPLLMETITDDTVRLWRDDTRVNAAVVYVADTHTIRLLPEQSLQPDQHYRVELTRELMSNTGEPYGGADWSFTTAGQIGQTSQETLDRCVTPERQALLEAVNEARQTARQCGNQTLPPAPPLTYQCALTDIAQSHADAMAEQSLLSHYSSDGTTLPQRADAHGYDWQALGENIARLSSTDADKVVDGWLAETIPCDTLMNPDYSHIGLGLAFDDKGRAYWVQDLAKPASGPRDD